jgi:hypothetical protein
MISNAGLLLMPLSVAWLAATEPTRNPVLTCHFKAGQVVIEQADSTGDVSVEVYGHSRRYVMDKLKLNPREAGLPTFLFQPDIKRWQWLNDKGEPIESTVCTEKPSLKTG